AAFFRRIRQSAPGVSMEMNPTNASSTLRVMMPMVSWVGYRGKVPCALHRPMLVFRPTVPVNDAGTRIDPPASAARESTVEPCNTPTPAPLDEPPETRWFLASHGLRGAPQCALVPKEPDANSTVWFFPKKTAACWRRRETMGPSWFHFSGQAIG